MEVAPYVGEVRQVVTVPDQLGSEGVGAWARAGALKRPRQET